MDLAQNLRSTLSDIEVQIIQVHRIARDLDTTAMQVRTSSGELMLTPLLLAKAQCLNGLALLKSSTR